MAAIGATILAGAILLTSLLSAITVAAAPAIAVLAFARFPGRLGRPFEDRLASRRFGRRRSRHGFGSRSLAAATSATGAAGASGRTLFTLRAVGVFRAFQARGAFGAFCAGRTFRSSRPFCTRRMGRAFGGRRGVGRIEGRHGRHLPVDRHRAGAAVPVPIAAGGAPS